MKGDYKVRNQTSIVKIKNQIVKIKNQITNHSRLMNFILLDIVRKDAINSLLRKMCILDRSKRKVKSLS